MLLGSCAKFEEVQVGGERFNIFTGCPNAKTCSLLLCGCAKQFIAEIECSLHDAIMIVCHANQHCSVVAGGGAIEMEISRYLRDHSRTIQGKHQLIIGAFAKALEILPCQLCDNVSFDATSILTQLHQYHAQAGVQWFGVDILAKSITYNYNAFFWEPTLVKINMLASATKAATLILSVDETVKNSQAQ